jgi:CHAT domain-containing protein/tetratricopeptide (TPR) repeat protein
LEFGRLFENSSTVRCMSLRRFATGTVNLDGNSATVRAEADLVSWSRHPSDRGREETVVAVATLGRRDGRWRITAWKAIEIELAAPITAGTPWRDVVPAALENGARVRLLVRQMTLEAVRRFNQNRPREGDPFVTAAIEIATEYADSDALSEAIGARSILQNSDPKQSEAWAEESLTLAQERGNPDVIARGLQRLARAQSLSRAKERDLYDRILSMAGSVESLVTLANASAELAEVLNHQGDYRGSLLKSLQTLEYGNATGEGGSLILANLGLGTTYLYQGDAEMALPYLERVVELSDKRDLFIVPHCLRMLAHALWQTNRRDEARARIAEAMALAGSNAGTLLLSRAQFSLSANDLDCAENDLLAAIAAGKEMGAVDLAHAWSALSSMRLSQGSGEEALACARMAGQLAEDHVLSDIGAVPAALALRTLGRLEEAAAKLRVSAAIADDQRASAVAESRQLQMFMRSRLHVYADLADVLVDLGKPEEAIEVVARFRGRTMRDFRGAAGGRPVTAADQQHRERLERRIEELNGSMLRTGGEASPELTGQLAKARLDLDDFLARAVAESATDPRTPGASRQVELSGVTVIEYLVARDRLLAFVRVPDGRVAMRLHVVPIAVTPARLRTSVDALVASIEQRDLRFARGARSLYDLLLAPVERFIGGARAVCIIPDGDLWRLPFHALRSANGRYLSERVSIFYAPSIDFFADPPARRGERPIDLLAFANATVGGDAAATIRALYRNVPLGALPDAETEVKNLARIYGPSKSRLYLGSQARESVFKRDGASSRVVHIATHGVLDDQSPMYSALILAAGKDDGEDGLLEAREIASMRLDADIAVLSACDTARGSVAGGEGVVGIAWAFLVAGCPTTVVSQWKADSAATAELMVAFHRHLQAGATPAEALRSAQRELRRNPRYRDPLYWAPFIVLGASR